MSRPSIYYGSMWQRNEASLAAKAAIAKALAQPKPLTPTDEKLALIDAMIARAQHSPAILAHLQRERELIAEQAEQQEALSHHAYGG